MKKIFIIFITIFIHNVALAKYSSWNCTKINEKISKCTSIVTHNWKGGGTLTVIYNGEIKNNKPEGQGKLTFQGNSKDYAEGFWTSNDSIEEYAPQLVEGFKFLSGETWYYKNKKLYKIKFISDESFEGIWSKDGYPIKGTYKYKTGEIFKGTFFKEPMYYPKEGTMFHADGSKYVGTFSNNQTGERRLKGTFYFTNDQVVKINNGKIIEKKLKKDLNFYWVIAIIIVGIFLFYKFNDDKYEMKQNKRKAALIDQIIGFMNSPIGTGILMLIIGIALFNLFNWASTDLEPGQPKFFGHDGG